ncbi:MAG: SIMPL domain-containing protein [Candidatus Paceibacterota bacterium]
MEIPNEQKRNLYRAGLALVIILCVFYAVRILSEFKSYSMMDNYGSSSITLAGHGEVSAVPDIATVSFTIHKEGKTVKIAQEAAAAVEKSALDFLKENKIEDKDIKTANVSFNPKYEYKQALCPQATAESLGAGDVKVAMPYYCGGGKQVLIGYESYESITVKVRDTDNVGKITQGLGNLGVTDLNGPNFAIDKEEDLKKEARKKAIDDAQEKAEILADDLGVKLGKIISFNEDGGYPGDMYYGKSVMMEASINAAPAPARVPKGENTISADVVIVYEIK